MMQRVWCFFLMGILTELVNGGHIIRKMSQRFTLCDGKISTALVKSELYSLNGSYFLFFVPDRDGHTGSS